MRIVRMGEEERARDSHIKKDEKEGECNRGRGP